MTTRAISRVFAATAAFAMLAVLFAPGDAWAQKKKKKAPAADPAPPEEPAETPPEQIEAQKVFMEANQHDQAKEYDKAIELYLKAFDLYPDYEILFVVGEAYRKLGDEDPENEDARVEYYKKAIEYFEKYKEGVKDFEPEKQRLVEPSDQRIEALSKFIAGVEEARKKAEDEKKAEEEAERKRKEEEEAKKQKALEEERGMQLALDAQLVSGIDFDLTALARIIAGGLLGWGPFALEGHLSFEGFLPIDSDKGVNATSVTVLDLGARYAFQGNNRFTGPFLSAGAGFGLLSGKPRERRLSGDTKTCMYAADFDPTDPKCTFEIDKDITFRGGLGWGFSANKKTTVAVRLDVTYWWYSVANSQDGGSPAPSRVEKPQTAVSVLLGLEFMRWK